MKKIKYLIILLIFSILFIPNISAKENKVNIYLFYSSTCPHCENEQEFLKKIEKKYDNVNVIKYEIHNETNNDLMNLVDKSLNDNNKYIPYTIIGTNSEVGFNEYTEDEIVKHIEECTKYDCMDLVKRVKEENKSLEEELKKANISLEEQKNKDTKVKEEKTSKMKLPLIGEVDVKNFSLPIIAASIGLVDGFNPCAMWVLIFLISMLLGMKNRKKMWAIGFSFLFTSALIYLLFMGAWLQVTLKLSQIRAIQILIAIVALIGAFVNFRSFNKERKKDAGCQVVNDKKRKNIIEKIKKFTTEKSLFLAIIGAMALAISVNFVELACSAGLPLLFTQILALNDLNTLQYIIYMTIYMICYLLDDIIIFLIAMISLKLTGISNKYNKYSHLIGGLIMFIMGLLMIIKPEWIMMNF